MSIGSSPMILMLHPPVPVLYNKNFFQADHILPAFCRCYFPLLIRYPQIISSRSRIRIILSMIHIPYWTESTRPQGMYYGVPLGIQIWTHPEEMIPSHPAHPHLHSASRQSIKFQRHVYSK